MNRIEAIHPHWADHFLLEEDGSLRLEALGSEGKYFLNNGRITVIWEKYSPEEFILSHNRFVHVDVSNYIPKLNELNFIQIDAEILRVECITVELPASNYKVTLRLRTSDIPTFQQVFTINEYENSFLPEKASTIVDLGANIGLAAVNFGLRYPEARILSVEPEPKNFALLLTNTARLGARVRCENAAVWNENGWVNLDTEDDSGTPLGSWGVQVSATQNKPSAETRSYRLETLLAIADFPVVDILKVDIEGAELQLFASSPELWLDRVEMVIVETHDRFRSGSESAVRAALAKDFEELPRNGENLFFRRLKKI